MIRTSHFRFLLATAAISAASPAFALDGADLMTKLNAAYASSGISVGYAGLDVSGSTVTLSGAELKAGTQNPMKIGTVTMEGVEEDGSGGYTIETVAFQDVNATDKGATVTARDLSLGGVTVPANATPGTLDSLLMYETASAGPFSVSKDGKTLFSMSGAKANMTRMEGDAGLTFDAVLSDIHADMSEVKDPKAKDALQKLGIASLDGKMTMAGSWTLADGRIAFDEYALDFKDIGRLNLTLGISGYTLDFIKGMQEAIGAAQANANKDEANAALGMSMMGLVQQLTFDNASVSFNDASITRRVLDFAGAQQGVSGEQMAQSLKGLAPLMIAQLNMPELQNQIAEAVNTYLDDPRSLTVSARPAKPVPFPMIMGAAMGAPTTLPQVLGVTVSAND